MPVCHSKFFRMGNQVTGGKRVGGEGVTVSVADPDSGSGSRV